MSKKSLFQLTQNALMTGVLLTLFGYRLFAEPIHEWLGLAFIVLITSHLASNGWWLKKLFDGM